jgi:outer membrane protein, heavy metal efflux system
MTRLRPRAPSHRENNIMQTSTRMCALTVAILAPLSVAFAQRSPQTPSGDTVRVTRNDAIALAVRANPQITIAREQLQQVRAQRAQLVAIPEPTLSASFDSLNTLRRFGTAPARPASLTAGLPFPDKFRLRGIIGSANINASESALTLVQQQLAAQAGRAYDSVLVARRHRRDLTLLRDLAAEFLKRAEARFNAGSVARLDVIRAQVDVAQAENALIGNARDIANADAALDRTLGYALGTPVVATDTLIVPAAFPPLATLDSLASRHRPELRAIIALQSGARAASTLARETAFAPDLTLGAGRDYAVPSGIVYSVGVSVPIPLFFWQHTRGEFAETRHRELELRATLRDAQTAVSQDLRTAYATADAALRQVVFLRDQLLPAASEAFRVSSVSYSLGGLSALDVLDARRSLVSALSQYADALAAANSSRSDLERATGVPLSTLPAGASRE